MKPKRTAEFVIQHLREKKVDRLQNLTRQLGVHARTVHRALRQQGYYSSINGNSTYVTLAETPVFNERGLWYYGRICFSRHQTLALTIKNLIWGAPRGCTVKELEALVATRVHNTLKKLMDQQCIARFYWGRLAVYVSADASLRSHQHAARTGLGAAEDRLVPGRKLVPEGCDVRTVLLILTQLIRTPQAGNAKLAHALQAEHALIDEALIRRVLAYYALVPKKTP